MIPGVEMASKALGMRGIYDDDGTRDSAPVQIQNPIDHRDSRYGHERLGHPAAKPRTQTGGRDDEHG